MKKTENRSSRERGETLITTLLILLVMLTLGAGALLYSVFDLKSTSHYNTGNQALFVAESGVFHALNVINRAGVANFNRDIVQQWSTLFSPNPQGVAGYANLTYQVTLTPDATSPSTRGTIRSIGLAPNNARRVVDAVVEKAVQYKGRGALYLAANSVSSQFSGNGFNIDGNNHDQFDNLVPGGPVQAGIATRNDSVQSSVVGSLNSQQKNNVKGLGFSLNPLTPSVVSTGGPSVSDLDNIISDILTNPNVVVDNSSNVSGNATYGTLANPQVTHLTASDFKVTANGNVSGAGIMVVDGSLTINGSLDFTGWILVRGDTVIESTTSTDGTTALGNATVLGSLWTGDLVVKVGGSAILNYCEYCLSLADSVPNSGTGYIPKTMKVVTWEEEM